MLKFNLITLFPQLIRPHLDELPFKKALEKTIIDVNLINLRDYAIDKHGTVDDKPYGGGTGMILRVDSIHKALNEIEEKQTVILLSPKGTTLTQKKARKLAKKQNITLISGRYEGVDSRVEKYVTDIISIGNYVLSGGELPALVLMESIIRLLPGVLEKEDATKLESFEKGLLEYPQYTRPVEYDKERVPEILLSGHHAEIEKWKKDNSKKVLRKHS